jgi:hypothetical protein
MTLKLKNDVENDVEKINVTLKLKNDVENSTCYVENIK